MRQVAEQHKDQAETLLAEAERGESCEGVELGAMSRDQKIVAAQTHALLACYFELRHQSEAAFP